MMVQAEESNQDRQRLKGSLALLPQTAFHQSESLSLQDVVIGKTVIAILLVDARQPLSLRILDKVRSIRNPAFLFLVCNQRSDAPLPNETQYYSLPGLGNARCILGIDACPGLAVVSVETGRKISLPQEELGLLWNSVEDVTAAWIDESSTCLRPWDRVKAAVLFPTLCIIQ